MAAYTQQQDTAIVWADTSDYSSTASGLTRTDQIDLTSLASDAARQGARADLGASRNPAYAVQVGLEYNVAPATTALAELYFVQTPNTTLLPAGTSGSDGSYQSGSETEWVRQAGIFVPVSLTADATTTVQYIDCGIVSFSCRYVIPILYNTGGQALVGDAVEMFIALIPIIFDIS